jgi:hypothetical protein
MANKVINIGNRNINQNNDIYVDISMVSDINLHNKIV